MTSKQYGEFTSSPESQLKLPIYWVNSDEELEQYSERLALFSELGVDCETTIYPPQICCLLQIACRDFIVLIDTFEISDFSPLQIVLEDPEIIVIAHSASFEKRQLAKYNIEINAVYDTLKISRKLRKYDKNTGCKLKHSLGVVCKRELNLNMDKGEQMSDWSRRPLSESQLYDKFTEAEGGIISQRLF
jgi:ribonuclease D